MESHLPPGRAHEYGVRAIYEVLLGRVPAAPDLEAWKDAPVGDVYTGILGSPEYSRRHGASLPVGDPSAIAALRLLQTNGLADLRRDAGAWPSRALSAVPFAAIGQDFASPSIRVIGGWATALAAELQRRDFSRVAAGLPSGKPEDEILVLTGPEDAVVVGAVRPDIIAAADRLLMPHEINPEGLRHGEVGELQMQRTRLHALGFAEVVRVFRVRQTDEVVRTDVSEMIPPEGLHEYRTLVDDPPHVTWLIANRVACEEER